MDEFRTIAKLWPSGADLDLGIDSNTVTVPATFTRHAANFVTSMDGSHNYQFLFWNTGRHLTNKRHVRWNFSIGAWGVWTATRWYGTPPKDGPGLQRVRVDGFSLPGNAPLGPDTAIDSGASTFAAGAWPFNGDDHEIGTAGGTVNVVAKDPFHLLQFAGWLRLIWGGDDSGEFVETDTGAAMGSSTFFEHSTGAFHVDAGGGADLLASYGNSSGSRFPKIDLGDLFTQFPDFPIRPGDPGPDDLIRLLLLQQLLRQTAPGTPVTTPSAGTDIQRVIENVPTMAPEELKRAKSSLQTSVDLAQSAISTIDAQLKKQGGHR
jgi:hypothetical protein